MLASSIPTKVSVPFAAGAGGGFIRTVPIPSQVGVTDGAASFTDGFPPLNFLPVGSGGVPPWGQDMNGLMNQVTKWTQWQGAGGLATYDSTFSTVIGGYPQGALLASTTAGGVWLCIVDNNTADPDAGGAGWIGLGTRVAYTFGQCRLNYASPTQIILNQFGGNLVQINGQSFAVPAAGITAANTGVRVGGVAGQNLAASTLYYVYLLNITGTLTLDFWTGANSGHMTDTTLGNAGVEVRNNAGSPDSTRTLVGMIKTSGTNFQAQGIGVMSWFNRLSTVLVGASTAGASVATGVITELTAVSKVFFLAWSNAAVVATLVGQANNNTSGGASGPAISIDGVASSSAQGGGGISVNGGNTVAVVAAFGGLVSEGSHYANVMGQTGGSGVASFVAAVSVAVFG